MIFKKKQAQKEKVIVPGLSRESALTLLLIYMNRKGSTDGIEWGFKGYEFKDLALLTKKGLISSPVGGRDSKSLWLTPAGSALGSLIEEILLPQIQELVGVLEQKE